MASRCLPATDCPVKLHPTFRYLSNIVQFNVGSVLICDEYDEVCKKQAARSQNEFIGTVFFARDVNTWYSLTLLPVEINAARDKTTVRK